MAAARPNYRLTSVAPVPPELDVPGVMNVEANPPPRRGFWGNFHVRLFLLVLVGMLVVTAVYAIIRLGFEKTRHHHHPLCNQTAVVSIDGTGDYTTVSSALENVPVDSMARFCIHIKPGRYTENLVVGPRKTNIAFIGDGPDQTILTAMHSQTLKVEAAGFTASNLTIENSGQVLATTSKHVAFYNCKIRGGASTLYAGKGKQFYRNCLIQGTDSMIYGNGEAYFQNCSIIIGQSTPRNSVVITSQERGSTWEHTGFVFDRCRIDSSHGSPGSAYLGCPGNNYSTVVYMRTFLSPVINQQGWTTCGRYRSENVLFAEFNNTGRGSSTEGRVHWKGVKLLKDSEAFQFRLQRFFQENIEWLNDTNIPYLLD